MYILKNTLQHRNGKSKNMAVLYDVLNFPVLYIGTMSFATIYTKENSVRRTPPWLGTAVRCVHLMLMIYFCTGVFDYNTGGSVTLLTRYHFWARSMNLVKCVAGIMNGSFWKRTKLSIINDATFPLIDGVLGVDTLVLGTVVDIIVSALTQFSEGKDEPPDTFQGKLSLSSVLMIKYVACCREVSNHTLWMLATDDFQTTSHDWAMLLYVVGVMLLGLHERQTKKCVTAHPCCGRWR